MATSPTIPTEFEFDHWGRRLLTTALPWSYIPEQWLARLPVGFLALLAAAVLLGLGAALRWLRLGFAQRRRGASGELRDSGAAVARSRNMLLVWVAAAAPVGFLMITHATVYDGVRHTLFVIPMLALLAGWALVRLARRSAAAVSSRGALATAYGGALLANLAVLHPLEYIATNALAGGTAGSYGRFELDYWSAGATEALRRLENRLDQDGCVRRGAPGILICIPYREYMAGIMLDPKWRLELDPDKADFVIESERSRCAADKPALALIDEVKRYDRAFAWTYVNKASRWRDAAAAP